MWGEQSNGHASGKLDVNLYLWRRCRQKLNFVRSIHSKIYVFRFSPNTLRIHGPERPNFAISNVWAVFDAPIKSDESNFIPFIRIYFSSNFFHCISNGNSIIHNFDVIILNDGTNGQIHTRFPLYFLSNASKFSNGILASLLSTLTWWKFHSSADDEPNPKQTPVCIKVSYNKLKHHFLPPFKIESLFTADRLRCHFLIVHAILAENLLFADGFENDFFESNRKNQRGGEWEGKRERNKENKATTE